MFSFAFFSLSPTLAFIYLEKKIQKLSAWMAVSQQASTALREERKRIDVGSRAQDVMQAEFEQEKATFEALVVTGAAREHEFRSVEYQGEHARADILYSFACSALPFVLISISQGTPKWRTSATDGNQARLSETRNQFENMKAH